MYHCSPEHAFTCMIVRVIDVYVYMYVWYACACALAYICMHASHTHTHTHAGTLYAHEATTLSRIGRSLHDAYTTSSQQHTAFTTLVIITLTSLEKFRANDEFGGYFEGPGTHINFYAMNETETQIQANMLSHTDLPQQDANTSTSGDTRAENTEISKPQKTSTAQTGRADEEEAPQNGGDTHNTDGQTQTTGQRSMTNADDIRTDENIRYIDNVLRKHYHEFPQEYQDADTEWLQPLPEWGGPVHRACVRLCRKVHAILYGAWSIWPYE
jgi:hypothetical protein